MNDAIRTELLELTAAEVDGSLTPDQRNRLADLLRQSAQARAEYLRYRRLHAALDWRTGEIEAAPASTPVRPASAGRTNPPQTPRSFSEAGRTPLAVWAVSGLAAAITLAAALAIYVFVDSGHRTSNPEDRTSSSAIATLIESTGTVLYDDNIANEGSEYAAGAYSIDAGSAQFLLSNRVTVNVRGKTRLHMHHAMHATLIRGWAEFNCPSGAEGFTVDLPGDVRVVDLGTRFEIETIETEGSILRVTEGRVRVESPRGGVDLVSGAHVLIDGDGLVTSFHGSPRIRFVEAADGASGNTFAVGGSLDDTSWVGPDSMNDNPSQWNKRITDVLGRGAVYQARAGKNAGIPALTTQITGLSDGDYEVWVFFWEQVVDLNDNWIISAGLEPDDLTTYSAPGQPTVRGATTDDVVEAGTLDFDRDVNTQGKRTKMFAARIGIASVTDGAPIRVYIDKKIGGGSNRVWYDGVGYRRVYPSADPHRQHQETVPSEPAVRSDQTPESEHTAAEK